MHAIYEAGGELDFVITLVDHSAARKSGRVYLDEFCRRHSIELFKTPNINSPECLEYLRAKQPDLLFIIGWSQVASPHVLAACRRVVGMHPTLLPEGRGRAAVPWAILKGLPETGVTMFQLDAGVDSGGILAQLRVPIRSAETATSLYERITEAHVELVRKTWSQLIAGTMPAVPQDESRATYWPGRRPSDGRLTPEMRVEEAERMVRAVTRPYPGAFVELADGSTLRIWSGRIAGGTPLASGAQRLQFADGTYDALEWEVEPPAPR